MIVKQELEKLGFNYTTVELGEIELVERLYEKDYEALNNALLHYGLELLRPPRNILIEKIKNAIVEMLHYNDEPLTTNFSTYLSEKLDYDYNYLSYIFSSTKGITIEQFIITHKIERVKELLVYDKLTLTEIAYKLHYSSVAHLSNQFKKVTGLTPSFFKKTKNNVLTGFENGEEKHNGQIVPKNARGIHTC